MIPNIPIKNLEEEYAWEIRERESSVYCEEPAVKQLQIDIMWKEQEVMNQHPLLDGKYPLEYREYFQELQNNTGSIRKELARMRRKNSIERKRWEEQQQYEIVRLQSLFEQRIQTEQHPLLQNRGSEDHSARLRHVKGSNDNRKLKDFTQQRDSPFKRLQESFSQPQDMLVSEHIDPEELNNIPIQLAILDASLMSDELYEKLTGESLKNRKLSKSEKLQKKRESLPLLRQIFTSAIPLRHFKRYRGTDGEFHGYLCHPYRIMIIGDNTLHSIPCAGSVMIISSHEYEDRENLPPKTQLFSSLYKAHRSLKHTLQSLERGRKEMNVQKTKLEQLYVDFFHYDLRDEQQKEQMLLRLYTSIEALEGKTSAESFFATMNLKKASSLKDKLGRVNPEVCKARIGGAMQRVQTRLGEIIEKQKYIQTQEKIVDNEITTQEIQLLSMLKELETFGERRFFHPNDVRLRIMIRNFKNILSSTPLLESPVGKAEPFKTYYDFLRQKVEIIEQLQQSPTPDHMKELNKTMVKIYTILKIFVFHQQGEHILDHLQFDEHVETGTLLQLLRDIFGQHFARKHFKVQKETRIPSYDKPFLEVRRQLEHVGQLLRDVDESQDPSQRRQLLQVLKSLPLTAIVKTLD